MTTILMNVFLDNGDFIENMTQWLTMISFLYILFPLIMVKDLKNIATDVIFPPHKIEIKSLFAPLVSFILFMGMEVLSAIDMIPTLISIGGLTYGILTVIYMSAIFITIRDASKFLTFLPFF